MQQIAITMFTFTVVVLLLAASVLAVRRWVLPSGEAVLNINDSRTLHVRRGEKLLNALARQRIYLPAACGGRGSCGQCRVRILGDVRALLPTEQAHISQRDARLGVRLACSMTLRDDLSLRLPDNLLEAKRWDCTVRSSRNVSTYMKELVLEVSEPFDFEAGDYVLLEAPPGKIRFLDFSIADSFLPEWRANNLLGLEVDVTETTSRAYSLANHPLELGIVMLVVRIATPPPRSRGAAPPGRVSSYIFGLKPGDVVAVSGPFGEFHAQPGEREMVFIGGGAGIAPMRSIIFDQLKRKQTRRTMSFWYGARSRQDLCYQAEFEALARDHHNFSYHVALAEPRAQDKWDGHTGLIHSVAWAQYLKNHPAPETVEYYLCGPPLMAGAVVAMLEDLGVDRGSIFFDDFGT